MKRHDAMPRAKKKTFNNWFPVIYISITESNRLYSLCQLLYPLNILIVAQIPVAVSMGGVFPWREGFHFNTELSAAGIAAVRRREAVSARGREVGE